MRSYDEWINENTEIGGVNLSLNNVHRAISNISNPGLKSEVTEELNKFQESLNRLMEKYSQQ